MKPVTYDFDVITDAPAPQRRAPGPAQPAPQPDAEEERPSGQRVAPLEDRLRSASSEQGEREHIRAAE